MTARTSTLAVLAARPAGRSAGLLGGALTAAAAAALGACSPYDPALGPTPYLCAAQEPRCPDRYECMDDGTRAVCVLAGSFAPDAAVDGPSGFQCAMDGDLEPNDSISQAYQTDLGTNSIDRVFGPISICPESDKDHYQINITNANHGIEVITRWDSGSAVGCSLLNNAGTAIAIGAPMGSNAIRACATNLPTGIFYAVAFSPKGLQNNYRIEMRIVDNCL